VLVGKDGRVRVTDFGLARPVSLASYAHAADVARSVRRAPGELVSPLTRSGVIAGTPAYMAPEQLLGRPSDARTDQFSFCVALYEALFTERPFAAENFEALYRQVLGGHVRAARAETDVPLSVRRILLRGLSVEPSQRYPTMQALLGALAQEPGVRRARAGRGMKLAVAMAAALAVAIAGGAYGLRARAASAAPRAASAGIVNELAAKVLVPSPASPATAPTAAPADEGTNLREAKAPPVAPAALVPAPRRPRASLAPSAPTMPAAPAVSAHAMTGNATPSPEELMRKRH
jgi:hypothetical protein